MDVSLESVPRKGLLSEEVSSLPSVQRSYISDSARLLSLLVSELVSCEPRKKGMGTVYRVKRKRRVWSSAVTRVAAVTMTSELCDIFSREV
jgi:hypothetical protein